MKGKVLFLGTGGSFGVPVVGCTCAVCQSTSPYNHRLRSSILLKVEGKTLLVDVGPDFRAQALQHKISAVDGVLMTHTHYDHIAGIDELRIFSLKGGKAIPCLVSEETYGELERRYPYLLSEYRNNQAVAAELEFWQLKGLSGSTVFEGLKVDYFTYQQLGMGVNGFRFGSFAYVTDIKDFDEEIFEHLKGLETLVTTGRPIKNSRAHLSLEEGIAFAKKSGAKKVYLTHISHEMDHEEVNTNLPESIELAYDGLEIEVCCG